MHRVRYYILWGHEAVPVKNVREWAKWFELADRHVDLTIRRGVRVSTVFLELDHSFGMDPPLLIETMVLGGIYDQEMVRYSTWDEAVAKHEAMCRKVWPLRVVKRD